MRCMTGGAVLPDDATLVRDARAGDRDAFAAIYDRYADRLHDLCWSVLRDDEASDAVQDTFITAWQRLTDLRDPAALRPWLYRIAWTEALHRRRQRGRTTPVAEVFDLPATEAGPEEQAGTDELRELVWRAAAGLADQDRLLLDLHVRQGLAGEELARTLGVSTTHGYKLTQRLRERVDRSLGALLIARYGRRSCPELAEILESWDGTFSPLIRKRVARHIDGCRVCGDRRAAMVSPAALLEAVPLVAAPAGLRDRVLEAVGAGAGDGGGGSGPGPSATGSAHVARRIPGRLVGSPTQLVAIAAAGAVLVVGAGAVVIPKLRGEGGPRLADPSVSAATITTFDGLEYEFRAIGDFVIARSSADDFEIQIRLEPITPEGGAEQVVAYTAVAASVAGAAVEVRAGAELQVFVDGEPMPATETERTLESGATIERSAGSVIVTWPDGSQAVISSSGPTSVELNLSVPSSRLEQLRGLSGHGDGDPANDLARADGSIVPTPPPSPGPEYLDRFYAEFAGDWHVSGDDSLFG